MWFNALLKTVSELHYPPTDVYETEKELVIISEVPGMSLKDLNIEVQDKILIISGQKNSSLEEVKNVSENRKYHLSERLERTFTRTFFLEKSLDPFAVNATFKDGLLKVTVQKKPLEPNKIQIQEEK